MRRRARNFVDVNSNDVQEGALQRHIKRVKCEDLMKERAAHFKGDSDVAFAVVGSRLLEEFVDENDFRRELGKR